MCAGLADAVLERNRVIDQQVSNYRRRFEARGLEYVRGFVAAEQARAPVWYLKCRYHLRFLTGTGLALEAAYQYLSDAGIDPFTCGGDFFRQRDR